jgi:hypothetical protein
MIKYNPQNNLLQYIVLFLCFLQYFIFKCVVKNGEIKLKIMWVSGEWGCFVS